MKKTGIGTFDVMNSFKEASEFIVEAVLPDGPVFVILHEVEILKHVARDVVDDGTNEVECHQSGWERLLAGVCHRCF
jgi:hypothetical protein